MKVGLLGCGVIGSGVIEIINSLNNEKIKLVKVFDRYEKENIKDIYCDNVDDVLFDENIDTVVEAMGGDKFAYECIIRALYNGKNVVTSNKEVVSNHFEQFMTLAKQKNVYFLFEASVGGGIPIIKTLSQNIKINKVNNIYGIINGTTNYILTQMSKGESFENALKKAQKAGFAEADPTADILGLDMVRKIAILASLAYSCYVPVSLVKHRGITKISKAIIDDVENKGYVVKFVAQAKRKDDDIFVSVEPVLVDKSNPLSNVNYENNCIAFESNNNGELFFFGKGAGKLPTATAIMSDLFTILDNGEKIEWENTKTYNYFDNGDSDYYVYENNQSRIVNNTVWSVKEKEQLFVEDELGSKGDKFLARIFE